MKKEEFVTNEMESFYWDLQEKVSKTYKLYDLDAIRVAFGVIFTFGLMESQVAKRLQQADMTLPGLNTLMLLAHGKPQGYPLSELSRYLLSTRANMTGVVDSLVQRGFAVRVGQADDRRVVLGQITSKGRAWLDAYFPGHAKLMGSFAGSLTSKERVAVLTLLAKMRREMPQNIFKQEVSPKLKGGMARRVAK